jgi:hypothetical protein
MKKDTPRRRWFRNRRRIVVVAVVLLLSAVFHRTLLRAAAYPLVSSGHSPTDDTATTYLLFLSDARLSKPAFQLAAEFVQADPAHRVLLYSGYIRRAEAIKAEPPYVEFVMLELEENGVPRDRIEVIRRPDSVTYTRMYRDMISWLDDRQHASRILVVTHRLKVGYMQCVANSALTEAERARIHIVGLPALGIDETNWWRTSKGVKWLAASYLSLVHLRVFGEFQPSFDWDPDAYERTLVAPSLEVATD